MAKYLGISKDFLRRYQGSLFLEGEHYFKPLGLNKFLWNVAKMEEWAFGKIEASDNAKNVLDIICKPKATDTN